MHKPHLGVIWCEVMNHVKCFEKEWIVDIPLFLFMLYIAFALVVLKKKHTQLYNKSTPLHEASGENGAEKLRKIYSI